MKYQRFEPFDCKCIRKFKHRNITDTTLWPRGSSIVLIFNKYGESKYIRFYMESGEKSSSWDFYLLETPFHWRIPWTSRWKPPYFSLENWGLQLKSGEFSTKIWGLQWKSGVSNENLGSPMKIWGLQWNSGVPNESLGVSNETSCWSPVLHDMRTIYFPHSIILEIQNSEQ